MRSGSLTRPAPADSGLDDEAVRRMMESLCATARHELRNPLSSLKGNAQLLVGTLMQDAQVEKARLVLAAVRRLEREVTALTDLWRMEPWNPTRVVVDRFVADWVREFAGERVAGGHGMLDLDIETAGAPAVWVMSEARVEKALRLLLRSLLTWAPQGRRWLLVVSEVASGLVLDLGSQKPPGSAEVSYASQWCHRDIMQRSNHAVAEYVARQHRGSLALLGAPVTLDPRYRMILGRL